MRCLLILSFIAFVSALPTQDARPEEVTEVASAKMTGEPKVEVSLERSKDGVPKLVVDITEKKDDQETATAEKKETDAKVENKDQKEPSKEVGAEDKGESRSTIHVHTPSSPQINLLPKYPPQSRPYYSSGPSQMQAESYEAKKKKEKKDKPYNQVNVYVYFPQDMMGEDAEMSVNSYNYDDGTSSSTMVSNGHRFQQRRPEPCPAGFARIKGVCLEVDRRKRVL